MSEITQTDIIAKQITGIQISEHMLWVCVDGACILRVKSPEFDFTDLRRRKRGKRQSAVSLRNRTRARGGA
jgi:hypothetical protein